MYWLLFILVGGAAVLTAPHPHELILHVVGIVVLGLIGYFLRTPEPTPDLDPDPGQEELPERKVA